MLQPANALAHLINDKGEVSAEGKALCAELEIDLSEVLPQPVSAFGDKSVPDKIKRLRFEHF